VPELPDAKTIIGLLADADRRIVLAALELGATTLEDAAKAGNLPVHRAAKAVGKLVDSGLVSSDVDGGFRVSSDAFAEAARSWLARPPSEEHAGEPPDRRRVLEAFVRDGRIISMPTAPAKRSILFDWLAGNFEVGVHYSEAEVNERLEGHVEDHVSLRRALVDEGLLDRDNGTYWRSGGTVD
jgi:hypothetical protein